MALSAAAQDADVTISFTDADAAGAAEADVVRSRQLADDADQLVALLNAEQTPGKYWIGVSCEAVSDSLRSQLDLGENVGLLVNEVMDGSPAKAAGLQPHDVLVTVALKLEAAAEERQLTEVADLNAVVQKAETKPLSLILFRKGKPQTVTIAPAERPKAEETKFEGKFINVTIPQHDPEKVQNLLQQLQDALGGGPQGMRLQMATPVVVAAPTQTSTFAYVGSGLPEGMTLTITKSGSNPARIEVKKGEGQVWGANENEIETLPPEAQGLAKAAVTGMSQQNFQFTTSPLQVWARAVQPPPPPALPMITSNPLAVPQLQAAQVARELADMQQKLADEQSQKGNDHPDVQTLKRHVDAMQQALSQLRPSSAPTPKEAFRNRMAYGSAGASVRTPEAPGQQQQIEHLQKQIKELTHLYEKQTEAQQAQMQELKRLIERIAKE
jgi:hypothetical protein